MSYTLQEWRALSKAERRQARKEGREEIKQRAWWTLERKDDDLFGMLMYYGEPTAIERAIIDKRFNVNERQSDGEYPIEVATRNANKKIVRLFLRYGASPTLGLQALLFSRTFNMELVNLFLSTPGCDVNAKDESHQPPAPPLWHLLRSQAKGGAGARGDRLILYLLDHGADMTVVDDEEGDSLLHVAAKASSLDWVNRLVAKGAKTSVRNKKGQLPIDVIGASLSPSLVYHPECRAMREIPLIRSALLKAAEEEKKQEKDARREATAAKLHAPVAGPRKRSAAAEPESAAEQKREGRAKRAKKVAKPQESPKGKTLRKATKPRE